MRSYHRAISVGDCGHHRATFSFVTRHWHFACPQCFLTVIGGVGDTMDEALRSFQNEAERAELRRIEEVPPLERTERDWTRLAFMKQRCC